MPPLLKIAEIRVSKLTKVNEFCCMICVVVHFIMVNLLGAMIMNGNGAIMNVNFSIMHGLGFHLIVTVV